MAGRPQPVRGWIERPSDMALDTIPVLLLTEVSGRFSSPGLSGVQQENPPQKQNLAFAQAIMRFTVNNGTTKEGLLR